MEKIERDRCLYFKRGLKYQTTRDFNIKLSLPLPDGTIQTVIPYAPVKCDYFSLDMQGNAVIYKKYGWNGASGPTYDTLNSMIGSLVHDFGYQLIRLGLIDPKYKELFDQMLHDLCIEDGMWEWRADYWQWAVLNFGAGSCRPSAEPQEQVAP